MREKSTPKVSIKQNKWLISNKKGLTFPPNCIAIWTHFLHRSKRWKKVAQTFLRIWHCCQVPRRLFRHFVKKIPLFGYLGKKIGSKRVFRLLFFNWYHILFKKLGPTILKYAKKLTYRHLPVKFERKKFPLLFRYLSENLIAVPLSNSSAKKIFFPAPFDQNSGIFRYLATVAYGTDDPFPGLLEALLGQRGP